MLKNPFRCLFIIMLLITSTIFGQSKKEQISILKNRVDSLIKITSFQKIKDSLKIQKLDSNIKYLNLSNEIQKNELINIYSKLKEAQEKLKKSDSLKFSHTEYNKIIDVYSNWKYEQVKNDKYISIDSCNIEFIKRKDMLTVPLAIPDDINILFGDLNQDSKLDALIWFVPVQCDGGNACMYCKDALLIVSKDNDYVVDEKFDKESNLNSDYLFEYSSINADSIRGYYWKQSDEYRMATLKGVFIFDYNSRKVNYY